MQQYFIKGVVQSPLTVRDKDTVKHMFSVMRLVEDDEVVLVFEDGIKRLARVADRERHVLNLVEELPDNAELPLHVTVARRLMPSSKTSTTSSSSTKRMTENICLRVFLSLIMTGFSTCPFTKYCCI